MMDYVVHGIILLLVVLGLLGPTIEDWFEKQKRKDRHRQEFIRKLNGSRKAKGSYHDDGSGLQI